MIEDFKFYYFSCEKCCCVRVFKSINPIHNLQAVICFEIPKMLENGGGLILFECNVDGSYIVAKGTVIVE